MSYRMLIDGTLVDSHDALSVINPATEELLASCPLATREHLDRAVAAAQRAFPSWSGAAIEERKRALATIAGIIEANADELARLLTQEQGKPLHESTMEVKGTAMFFRYFSSRDLPVNVLDDSPNRRVEIHRTPLGVVAAIVPWNVPLGLAAFKLPPALLAGNTVVLKPAPTTPLTALRLGELVKDVLPPGVLNIITDGGEIGPALTSHPGVRKLSFTGSTATGRRVMQSAAADLKRVTLELGGNDAAIVLHDVDPERIAPAIFGTTFRNAGQICVSIKRLYVHEAVYDAMCDALAELANAAVVGNGLDDKTQIGPVQNKRQYERIASLIDDASKHGRIISGHSAAGGPGYFIRPTIVRDISDGTRLVDEEQFGPVLPIIRCKDADDALARANASSFGLGGSVWSRDVARATTLAARMEAGLVWVNQHMALAPNIPLAGAKQSGFGIELGDDGIAEFTQLKVLNIAR
jgi:acyl-CoA reductase-like NAD-dependent aldehyde dehydrogenase